jgi:hypothetical protein
VWDLEENAGAIAGLGIASASPAVGEVEQYLDSLTYDFVTLVAANVGHESNAASVVLLGRMVQPLSGRMSIRFVLTRHHYYSIVCIVASAAYAAGTQTRNFLLSASRGGKYNPEFRWEGCKKLEGCKNKNFALQAELRSKFLPRETARCPL